MNYYSRKIYETQLRLLSYHTKEKHTEEEIGKLSNRMLLTIINGYLRQFNCQQYSPIELRIIQTKMND